MKCQTCPSDIVSSPLEADNPPRQCPECFERFLEDLATTLDPSYDRTQLNEWERCGDVLSRYYGPWEVGPQGWWLDRFELARMSETKGA